MAMTLANKNVRLEEAKQLISRIAELPSKKEDLHNIGFSDREIEDLENILSLLDVKANTQLKRMKELIDYKSKLI